MNRPFHLGEFSRLWSVGFWRCSVRGEYQSMRSALCALAPSHPLHAMPPRITRNSHRPRASDRTMVDLEHQFRLPLFRTRWHRHHPRRKLMSMGNQPNFSREAQLQWAGSRETNLASGRGRTFFLTSLFIELIDQALSAIARLQALSPVQAHRAATLVCRLRAAPPNLVRRNHVVVHHTRQAFSRTMGWPALQLNAFWNSGMFSTTPVTRYFPGE